MLYIANKENTSECGKVTHWTLRTGKEVSESFEQYFSGKVPDITILQSAFANGHFHFCGPTEINEVLATLYTIKEKGASANKSHIEDFIGKIEAIK